MTRVALFGANGFLGRWILRDLVASPRIDAVVALDIDQMDLTRVTVPEIEALLSNAGIDVVVSCAGMLGGSVSQLVAVHTSGTAKLIDAMSAVLPGARLVRVGSAAEYGRVARGWPVDEEHPTEPLNAYGLSHLAATGLVRLASVAGQVDGLVLRVFNPIGPDQPASSVPGRAVALIRAALVAGSGHITLGSLAAHRDFVDVRDVASAVTAAVLADPAPAARVINVASGRAVPVRQVVEMIAAAAGFTGEIREQATVPGRSAAVDWIAADVSRAARILGWRATHPLAESAVDVWTAAEALAGNGPRG